MTWTVLYKPTAITETIEKYFFFNKAYDFQFLLTLSESW